MQDLTSDQFLLGFQYLGTYKHIYSFWPLHVNPFQPKLILVHTTVTVTCRRAYKTCKNWPLCSYVGWHQHSQPNAQKSAQCAKMTTGANGQKACILRTDEKHDAIWHHGTGKG